MRESRAVPRGVANDTVGMRSSMNDLVAFYRRSLAGEFFGGKALEGFRVTMSTGSSEFAQLKTHR